MWRAFVSADDADHLEWSGRASECYARSRVWVSGEQMVNPLIEGCGRVSMVWSSLGRDRGPGEGRGGWGRDGGCRSGRALGRSSIM